MEFEKGKVTSVRFLRVNRLIDDLRRERVDQVLSYKYLVGLMLIHNVNIVAAGYGANSEIWALLLATVMLISLTMVELSVCHNLNKQGDNRDFLKRYIAISFVVELCMLVLYTILNALLGLASSGIVEWLVEKQGLDVVTVTVSIGLAVGLIIRTVPIFWKAWAFKRVSKPLTV